MRGQLTALASELAQLRERIGRSSRNSSKPPSRDGFGLPLRASPLAISRQSGARAVVASPISNADGNNPNWKRGRLWVMVTAVVTVFVQGLSCSTAAAIELLGNAFGGIVVRDRFLGLLRDS